MKLLLTLACSAICLSNMAEEGVKDQQNQPFLTESIAERSYLQTDSTVIEFISVNKMPPFKGGMSAFQKKVQKTVVYPKEAKATGHYGKVFVTFIVELDGSISNVKVLRKLGKGCDEAAVEAIKKMSFEGPAIYKDIPVRMRYNMAVGFGV
ncbi:energy transducer TonB [Pedobacter psychroterrae]|uniref:Energy transducer TonB n=1 Tax=Pedobacter psychroterrae TaxID=2530453 RepID=A0A4R0NCY9_9SPHI|nr:energy transducer TonB [Pedobacter psychroterrae]TCC98211.1 energy transducer TonB [Pedobacter psychroterrae]